MPLCDSMYLKVFFKTMSPNSLENPDSSFRLTAAMLIKNPTEVLNNLGRLIFTIEEKKNRPKFMLEGRKSSIHSISIDRPKTAFKLGRLAFQATQRYLAIKFMNSSEQFKLLKLIAILLDIKKIIRLAETEHSMEDLTDLMNNFFFGIRLEVEESGINHISFFSLLFVFERSESEDYIDTETSRRIFMMRNLISLLSKKKYLINMSIFEKQDFLDSCLSDHEIIKDALLVMSSNLNYINFEALESFLFCLYDQSKEKFKFINCILSISQYFQKYDVDLSRHMSAIAQKLSVKFGRPKSAERESFSAIEATDHGISTTHSSQIEHLLDRLAILSTKDAPLLDNQSLSDISICFERVLKKRFIHKEKLQSILSCL